MTGRWQQMSRRDMRSRGLRMRDLVGVRARMIERVTNKAGATFGVGQVVTVDQTYRGKFQVSAGSKTIRGLLLRELEFDLPDRARCTQFEREVLSELARFGGWARPMDIGGCSSSPHSAALQRLCSKGLAQRRPRDTLRNQIAGCTAGITLAGEPVILAPGRIVSWEYRTTELGDLELRSGYLRGRPTRTRGAGAGSTEA